MTMMNRSFRKRHDRNRPFGGGQLVKKVFFGGVRTPKIAPTPTPPPEGEGLYCEGTAYPQPAKGLRPLNLTRFFDRLKPSFRGRFSAAACTKCKGSECQRRPAVVFLDFPHVLCYNEKNSSKSDVLIFFEK